MIILDTHVFVWLATDTGQLSQQTLRTLEKGEDDIAISMVTSWEIALLYKLKRLQLPKAPVRFIVQALENHGISELGITRQVIHRSIDLPDIHKDPFDRILIAEAMIRNAALITKDKTIAKYPGIQTIW